MSIAVVFDSAGTLLHTYRAAKDVVRGILLPGIETVTLTFSSRERVLTVIHVHSRQIMNSPPDMLLSRYMEENLIGFGISCTRKIVTATEIGDVLYTDTTARLEDLQDCIRNVWDICRRESVISMNSGVILNMADRIIEFTVTTGGRPFDGASRVIDDLHRLGIPTYIASGDRAAKLEKMADFLGIPRDRVFGVATPTIKAQIIADLQAEFDQVVMVGDGINDLCAMKRADIAIVSEEQSGEKPEELYEAADFVIKDVHQVVDIVKKIIND